MIKFSFRSDYTLCGLCFWEHSCFTDKNDIDKNIAKVTNMHLIATFPKHLIATKQSLQINNRTQNANWVEIETCDFLGMLKYFLILL